MFCFSLLVNSWSLKTFITRLKMACTLFSSTHVDDEVKKCFDDLREEFKSLALPETEDDNDDDSEVIVTSDEEEAVAATRPFQLYILKEINNYHTCLDIDKEENKFYLPAWLTILTDKWLSTTPFWSSILRGY